MNIPPVKALLPVLVFASLVLAVLTGTAYAVASTAATALGSSIAKHAPVERIAAGSFAPLPLAPAGLPPTLAQAESVARCDRLKDLLKRYCLAKARAERWRHRDHAATT
jgi:hypothetical protein